MNVNSVEVELKLHRAQLILWLERKGSMFFLKKCSSLEINSLRSTVRIIKGKI